jgi:beta-glucosidase
MMPETTPAPLLVHEGHTFRDLNKNGRLDPYEDSRLPIEERITDLLAQMTLEEKAGLMFHTIMPVGQDGHLVEQPSMFSPLPTSYFVSEKLINHFNVHQLPSPRLAAEWHNRLQSLAESTRLGIPITLSSDPRHAFSHNVMTNIQADAFSLWPEPIGLAASNDEALVTGFADIARQEYLAVGIRAALHPMADLATEPRWARINGTFGEDAALSARMVSAYIQGFQGPAIGPQSVACMTKHFPGGGPQKDGLDAHFSYGKEQVYPGNNFDYHLLPFEAAFRAGTAQIMPYYGQPIGLPIEEVGFGFNKVVITTLLREKYGFDGVVCTDWGLINPVMHGDEVFMEARAWGVEHLTPHQRMQKALEAGVDQFGGEACPEIIVALVRQGLVSEERINQSARRLLRDKFRLGLFDAPFVDPDLAAQVVGCENFRHAGELAQRKSIVLLKNAPIAAEPALPLAPGKRIYVEGIDPAAVSPFGQVVSSVDQADIAILRLNTPSQPNQAMGFFASFFHEGDLDFKEPELARILAILDQVPTIVDIYLDRPAVIPEISSRCAALLGSFGSNDTALLDVIFGRSRPTARLPFELPASMEAVRRQKEDLPYDSGNPLYPFGHGLTY